jgi:DNA-binding transcriptional regulator YiaG
MSPREFRKVLHHLDLRWIDFSQLFGVSMSAVRNWAADGGTGVTNMPTKILIKLLVKGTITTNDIEKAKH